MFTVLFVITAIFLIVAQVVFFYYDNIIEDKALVPLIIIEDDFDVVKGDVTVKL
jgi:hypothetical protein